MAGTQVSTPVPGTNSMEILFSSGSKITFDNIADPILASRFQHFNTHVFDGLLPATEIRWAKVYDAQGLLMHGRLVEQHEMPNGGGPYIFLDQRLKSPAISSLADLALTHALCQRKEPTHNAAFVKEDL